MSSDFSAAALISVNPFQYDGHIQNQYPLYGSMGTNQISVADFNNDENIDLVTSNVIGADGNTNANDEHMLWTNFQGIVS